MYKAYKYRMYPDQPTQDRLNEILALCCELYNAALQERRDAWNVAKNHPNFFDPEMRKVLSKQFSFTNFDQINELVGVKEVRPELKEIGAHVLSEVMQRVDKSFKGFFSRVKRGDKAGFPRFRSKRYYDSFTYPDTSGWKILENGLEESGTVKSAQQVSRRNRRTVSLTGEAGNSPTIRSFKNNNGMDDASTLNSAKKISQHKREISPTNISHKFGNRKKFTTLRLAKIGDIAVRLHRPYEGSIKTVTIKRELDQWYVVLVCDVAAMPLPVSYKDVGIDMGITHFITTSDGQFVETPGFIRKAEARIARIQQELARKVKGSNRYKKCREKLAKAFRKVRNQRKDFLHKESRKLINEYQVIAIEDLQVKNMSSAPKPKQDETTGEYLPNGASAKAGLNKSILDAAWGMFALLLQAKATTAGRTVVAVNPKNTSQKCSGCGEIVKKDLSVRWHSCSCGCELDRDHNAAINILRAGQALQKTA